MSKERWGSLYEPAPTQRFRSVPPTEASSITLASLPDLVPALLPALLGGPQVQGSQGWFWRETSQKSAASESDGKLLHRRKRCFASALPITEFPYHLTGTLNENLIKINKLVGCQLEWKRLPVPLYFSHLHYYLPI